VPGDDPSVIASGPTVPDRSTSAEALAILRKYDLRLPRHVLAFLSRPESETLKAGDPRLARAEAKIIAAPSQSLAAAARRAREAGFAVIDLGDRIEGEARRVAEDHARLNAAPGTVILSGGETTVTVKGQGRGGRNTEYLLSLAIALGEAHGRFAIAADTDGIDGSEVNAGALITPNTLKRAKALGLDAAAHLAANDAYSFFSRLGDLIVTGPTRTNVNDFRAMLV
jgi:glycerate 2-kinase